MPKYSVWGAQLGQLASIVWNGEQLGQIYFYFYFPIFQPAWIPTFPWGICRLTRLATWRALTNIAPGSDRVFGERFPGFLPWSFPDYRESWRQYIRRNVDLWAVGDVFSQKKQGGLKTFDCPPTLNEILKEMIKRLDISWNKFSYAFIRSLPTFFYRQTWHLKNLFDLTCYIPRCKTAAERHVLAAWHRSCKKMGLLLELVPVNEEETNEDLNSGKKDRKGENKLGKK